MKRAILVVDDEIDMLMLLKRSLATEFDCTVETAPSGEAALQLLGRSYFDLVLADIRMPGMDGLELLELIKRDNPDQTVVMMTAFGRIETAVQAMKSGAFDFVTKPFDHETLIVRLEKALERSSLLQENIRLQRACAQEDALRGLVGKSAAMGRIFETMRMVANNDMTVLITGESGTGKDLTARAIHNLSRRRRQPFVSVNCPTVPEHILESELFGYKKGAFTHATQNKIGLFQEAQGGTIFLDEIGDISPAIQTKLLRVIQEKEIKPLGDTKTIRVDVRIIASTNRNLKAKMEQGEYREDLFYRLNVLPIHLPPLRERREDIPLIANHLIEKHSHELNKPGTRITPELMEMLVECPWEGNVRELENIIVRGILYASDGQVRPRDIGLKRDRLKNRPTEDSFQNLPYRMAKEETLKRFNASYIGHLLATFQGNVTQAAKQCGLERQALQQIMRRYDIKAEPYRQP